MQDGLDIDKITSETHSVQTGLVSKLNTVIILAKTIFRAKLQP